MKKHVGGVAEYRSSEGKTVEIPYRGPLEPTVLDILGGLRSACTYVGAAQLKELSKRTTFIRVTAQLNETFRALHEPETGHGYTKLSTTGTAGAGASGSSPAPPILTFTQNPVTLGAVTESEVASSPAP